MKKDPACRCSKEENTSTVKIRNGCILHSDVVEPSVVVTGTKGSVFLFHEKNPAHWARLTSPYAHPETQNRT